ncbi:MAG: hypothetical protein R3F49_11585 [Planctomycetota bacterium]
MDHGTLAHLQLPIDLAELGADDPRVEAVMSRWDELAPERLTQLSQHPVLGQRLQRLREAEAWLGRGLTERRRRDRRAPRAEELYDFGGGPRSESRPLIPLERRREIERHLAADPTEARWVDRLAQRPMPPLLFNAPAGLGAQVEGIALEEDEVFDEGDVRRPRAPWLARWMPLAAAALVLALGVDAVRQNRDTYQLAERALMRGALDEPLSFPRGRVLGAPPGSIGLFASEPRFEFRALPDATGYRVTLSQHAGGAFDAGTQRWTTTEVQTDVDGPFALGPALTPGHYTWEVFATVDGLERSIGTLDFHVELAPDTLARLIHEPLIGQVQRLAAEGLLTDARHRARQLPPGPARERILGGAAAR